MGAAFEKGLILYRLKRYRDAAAEFHNELASAPQSAPAKSMLALACAYGGRARQGWELIKSVLGDAPNYAFGYYAASHVVRRYQPPPEKRSHRSFRLSEFEGRRTRGWYLSRRYALEALRLTPQEPDFLAALAECEAALQHWGPSLVAAERGLAVRPDHLLCTALRSRALMAIGQSGEARRVVGAALALDPEHPPAHTAEGWFALAAGDHRSAEAHFRDALRGNPADRVARDGLTHARMARLPPYRVLVRILFRVLGPEAKECISAFVLFIVMMFAVVALACANGGAAFATMVKLLVAIPIITLVVMKLTWLLSKAPLLRDPVARRRMPLGQRLALIAWVAVSIAYLLRELWVGHVHWPPR
jgi:tetratricopeptide (TPR) repeat protein